MHNVNDTILRLKNIKVNIITAVSSTGVIGKNGKIPWHIPEELQYFRDKTMGCPIIMGSNTFVSIGKPLPGRENVVITSQKSLKIGGITIVQSLEEALDIATLYAYADDVSDVYVIGGAQVYQQAFKYADRMYISEVKAWVDGDVYFPEFKMLNWSSRIVHSEEQFNVFEYTKC